MIRGVLRDRYLKGKSVKQLAVLLSIISDIAASNPVAEHKYYLTTVHYNVNQDEIRASSFTITQTADKVAEDIIALTMDFFDFSFSLNRAAWESFRGEAEDRIKAGKSILNEMPLDFFLS
ncbi:hypothetical protein F5Y10DRAFT_291192 [Nemania abortiva]|nr:hypothetical protein F5Y10DRAFT_291192 [Nemania abortiva]